MVTLNIVGEPTTNSLSKSYPWPFCRAKFTITLAASAKISFRVDVATEGGGRVARFVHYEG